MGVFDSGGAGFRLDRNGWRRGGEQGATLDQLLFTDAIGEEAEMADADQPRRQHVEQEAADELNRIEGHGLSAGMVRVVFPVEADVAVFQRAKTVIGDGDAVSVASQILEHASWATEGRLDVNDPFELRGYFTHGLKRGRLGQIAKLAREVKPTFAKSSSQIEKEEFAEQAAEDLIRKEEGILPASDPAAAVGGEAAAGHDAVQVRMKMQVLTPGMQHGKEADGGAEMSGVAGDGEQSFRSSLKQDGIDLSGVLKCQATDLLWKREHDVEVRNGQQLRFPVGEPLGASGGLALGASAIATRVEYFDEMSAPVALIEMTTQDGCPAVTNISKRFPLLARQDRVPASQEIVLMSAEYIGQFQPMRVHPFGGRRRSDSSDSSGLVVPRTFTSATCR